MPREPPHSHAAGIFHAMPVPRVRREAAFENKLDPITQIRSPFFSFSLSPGATWAWFEQYPPRLPPPSKQGGNSSSLCNLGAPEPPPHLNELFGVTGSFGGQLLSVERVLLGSCCRWGLFAVVRGESGRQKQEWDGEGRSAGLGPADGHWSAGPWVAARWCGWEVFPLPHSAC